MDGDVVKVNKRPCVLGYNGTIVLIGEEFQYILSSCFDPLRSHRDKPEDKLFHPEIGGQPAEFFGKACEYKLIQISVEGRKDHKSSILSQKRTR